MISKGDALGFIVGGLFAIGLGVFCLGATELVLPCFGAVTRSQNPLAYWGGIALFAATGVLMLRYGWRSYRAARRPPEKTSRVGRSPIAESQSADGRTPFWRVLLGVAGVLVGMVIGGPLLALAGQGATATLAVTAVAILAVGVLTSRNLILYLGFLMLVVAGVAGKLSETVPR